VGVEYYEKCDFTMLNHSPISAFIFGGHVRREFMQRLSAALHGTLGSYLRDALHEGNANALVYCLLF
jgi:hypothetical protein